MSDHSSVEATLKGNDQEQQLLRDENGEEITAGSIMEKMDFIGTKITEVSTPPCPKVVKRALFLKKF